jgi:hypothetical protein
LTRYGILRRSGGSLQKTAPQGTRYQIAALDDESDMKDIPAGGLVTWI